MLTFLFSALCLPLVYTTYADSPKRLRLMAPLVRSATFDHVLNDVVRAFNAQTGKKIQIDLLERGDSFETLRAVISAHYAGDLPDIAMVNVADLPTLEALHIVKPLPEKWFSEKKIFPHLLSATKCDGKPCSLPFQRRTPVWFYNQELLFKLNLDPKAIPTSLPQLVALADKIKKNSREIGEIFPLLVPTSGESALPRWCLLGLGQITSPVDTPLAWLDHLKRLPRSWTALVAPGRPSATDVTRIFLDRKGVILAGSLPLWNNLKSNASFKFGAVLPQNKDLAWSGTDLVVLGHETEAREFLDYLYRPEVALRFHEVAATLPVSKNFAAAEAWKKELERWPLLKSLIARPIKPLNSEKIPPSLREEWVSLVWQAIERGESSADLKPALQKLLSTNPR